jgi:2-dehydropantoate 2-reductase
MPNVSLIGAGSVGSLLASALLANGIAFKWIARNPARLTELKSGLDIQLDGQPPLHLPIDPAQTTELASDASASDWIILAVKAQQVLPLLAELAPYPGSKVLAVANGIHEGPFHLGLLYGGAYLQDGALVTGTANRLVIGPLGVYPDWSGELLSLLQQDWLHVENTAEVDLQMWLKAALNCIVNPLTALLDCPNGELLGRLDSPLVAGLIAELEPLLYRATDKRLALAPHELRGELEQLLTATAANSSSMREDWRRGRETEIERLSLAVVSTARVHGLDCPLNACLGRMVSGLTNTERL